jgi:phosphoglycerate dehydrogenase-like enzyme
MIRTGSLLLTAPVTLDDLLHRSDFISLVLSRLTYHMISAETLVA